MAVRDNLINVNVLDTLEEISANTSSGKAAGALAVKQINMKLEENRIVNNSNFKASKKNGIAYISFDGYPVTSVNEGNIWPTMTQDLIPKSNMFFAVSHGNMIGVTSNGKISLFTNDLTQYATGTIFGALSYVVNE